MVLKDNWQTGDPYTAADANAVASAVNAIATPSEVGSALVSAADEQTAREAIGASPEIYVNAKDYGATGDGTTDDTTALQDWLDYIVANRRQGYLPNGTYKITSTLIAPTGYGWTIRGESVEDTLITQFTDNIPVLQIGNTSFSHTWTIEQLHFTYNSAQPVTNTNAICILFHGAASGTYDTSFQSRINFIRMTKGYYGIRMTAACFGAWGMHYDNILVSLMSGGFYDATGTIGGCPNNFWGRVLIVCNDAVGPIFKNWKGYNTSVGTIEFLEAYAGPTLIEAANSFSGDFGALKLENGTYTASGALFSFQGAPRLRIGHIDVGGSYSTFTPASGSLSIVLRGGTYGTEKSYIDISSVAAGAVTLSGSCVVFTGGSSNTDPRRFSVGEVSLANGWTLQPTQTGPTGVATTVRNWVNGALGENAGDADYTVTPGSPNVIPFETAFTAQRTIQLPSVYSDDLCGSIYYDFVFNGAINGSNTVLIKERTNTLRTQTKDKVKLRYMWKRYSWNLVEVIDLSDPVTTYAPTNVSTDRAFDADATTVEELADVLGTLIADLKTKGIITP